MFPLAEFIKDSPKTQLAINVNKLPQYMTTHSPSWRVT